MIHIQQLNFSVGSFALCDVSLHVEPGEYFVLLGPTGSGKTLLVECLCGLNRIDSGRIWIGESRVTHDVTRLEPYRRGVGYLPQDYALFPHQTVRQNIAFGLRRRGLPPESARQQVDHFVEQLDLARLVDRFPARLSGGEQQRVALARALAIEPKLLLLDEPVSAVDEKTREHLCRLLKRMQRRTHTTTIHVCHNFVEMLTVADRAGIIEQGRILQVGTPQEILERPNNTRVAQFVQAGNLLAARAEPDGEWVRLACAGGIEFRAPRPDSRCPNGDVVVMVRPENVRLGAIGSKDDDFPPGSTILVGSIGDVVDLGPLVKVTLACGPEAELLVILGKKEYNDRNAGVGDRVQLSVSAEDVHVMQE